MSSNLISTYVTSVKGKLTERGAVLKDSALSVLFEAGNRFISTNMNSVAKLDTFTLLLQQIVQYAPVDNIVDGSTCEDAGICHAIMTDDLTAELLPKLKTIGDHGRMVLTLADGHHVKLDFSADGVLAASSENSGQQPTSWENVLDDHHLATSLPVLDGFGRVTRKNITEIADLVCESAELDQSMIDTLKLAVSGKMKSAADLFATLTEAISSKYQNVRQFAKGVNSAFSTGGIKGVLCFVLSYAKTASGMAVDDDGLIAFTDNANLTPATYLTGLLSTVVDVLLTIVQIIVSIIWGPIGFIFSTIAQGVWQAIKAVKWDFDSTNAKINNESEAFCLPALPYAFFQAELEWSIPFIDANGSPTFGTLLSNSGVVAASVPGGYLLMWPGENPRNDGGIYKMRAEFHPDLLRRSPIAGGVSMGSGNRYSIHWTTTVGYLKSALAMGDARAESTSYDNATEAGLDDVSDKEIRATTLTNAAYFYYWLICQQLGENDTVTMDGSFDGSHFTGSSVDDGIHSAMSCAVGGNPEQPDFNIIEFRTPAWEEISTVAMMTSISRTWLLINSGYHMEAPDLSYTWLLDAGQWSGDWFPVDITLPWILSPAKYTKSSVILGVVASIGAVVLAATVAVVGTIKFVKWCNLKRAQSAARVESAWTKATAEPTAANIKAYQHQVFKANLGSLLWGGTRYDKTGFWNGDPSADSASSDESSGSISDSLKSGATLLGLNSEGVDTDNILMSIKKRIG